MSFHNTQHKCPCYLMLFAKMRRLQFFQNLQLTDQLSEFRKYWKFSTFLFICFTGLVLFKAKNSRQIVFQPCQSTISLEKPAQNITEWRLKEIADQNTTSSQKNAQNMSDSRLEGLTQNISVSVIAGEQNNVSKTKPVSPSSKLVNHDQNLFDELAVLFDRQSCLSRYQSSSYRKNQPYKPSPYLISKLKGYQELHTRCGPNTPSYRRVVRKLSRPGQVNETIHCKYLIWTPANGLGNRMVSITSAFLYALLESRVLLVQFEAEMDGLFCEPFPNSTWLLPEKFPYYKHRWSKLQSFKSRVPSGDVPYIIHIDLQHGNGDSVLQHFHCNATQSRLQKIPVLVLKSDQYFVPSLFMVPFFRKELNRIFQQKGAVFHLLGHYLFNPSNSAWGLITRFYLAYLAKADQKIGLQIRGFSAKTLPYENIMTQILSCTSDHDILPSFATNKSLNFPSQNPTSKTKAVLVASLYHEFSENLRSMYWTRPTTNGDVVGVYQPSHEEYQKFGDNMHNLKAWAEIYLLSLCDVVVTSGQSTFGYVAQGLGGLNPWILDRLDGSNVRKTPCKRGISSEPCFHIAPKNDCSGKKIDNITTVNPHLRSCEDLWWGIKLVNNA